MSAEIEYISDNAKQLAMIIRDARTDRRVEFFSEQTDALQVGAFSMAQGQEIAPHVHQIYSRTLDRTTEVLVMQAGRMKIDFYSEEKVYLQSREISAGDVIVLFDGGHGFTMLDDVRMLEIKQGPYGGDKDKVRFVRPANLSTSI
jgi:hypothetical protein